MANVIYILATLSTAQMTAHVKQNKLIASRKPNNGIENVHGVFQTVNCVLLNVSLLERQRKCRGQ